VSEEEEKEVQKCPKRKKERLASSERAFTEE